MFCLLILKSKLHKRHLLSFPDTAGLMGVQDDALSLNLRDCGVLGIASHCEEFSTTHVHLRLQLKFRTQTGSLGCVARDKKCHWLLRKRECMCDRKLVRSQQRSLSSRFILPRHERPLLAD